MKKLISITLLIIFMTVNTCYSNPIDIINEIRNRDVDRPSTANSLILNALDKNKNNIEVEIIKDKKDVSEVKKTKTKKVYKDRLIGIDISKWNGDIDWKSVKDAGIDFVIIRAGYGTGYVDPYFKQNIESAIKNDMLIGVYWFSYAYTSQQAKAEADKCYKTIKPYKKHITLPVFWDFEYDSVNYANRRGKHISKKLASNMADTFCTNIKSKGIHAGIYSNIDYTKRYFTEEVMNKYHTWIAQWTSKCTYKNDYIIWQCSDKFYIKGKRFDLNYLYYNRFILSIEECFNKPRKKMTVSATAYSGDKITSTGTIPRWGVIAVDPSVIPYGSTVYIPTFNRYFIAEDCGGGIKGNRIDIFMTSEQKCRNWGVRKIEIEILE